MTILLVCFGLHALFVAWVFDRAARFPGRRLLDARWPKVVSAVFVLLAVVKTVSMLLTPDARSSGHSPERPSTEVSTAAGDPTGSLGPLGRR